MPHKPRSFSVRGDLRQTEDAALTVDSIKNWLEKEGREMKIDILVNNAGCELLKTLGSITAEDFNHFFDLNV
jgi:3-oxoacyl-[acyl-carrier protein] reductase